MKTYFIHSSVLKYCITAITLTALPLSPGHAESTDHLKSKYAGQQSRTIKSLSEDDIKQLSAGQGWGLAKAAELNGMPGPAHLLEMKKEIKLTPRQEEKIIALYDGMKNKAQALGKQLIEQEAKLNKAFADRTINTTILKKQLSLIADTRKQLRFVHLATHLETPGILTAQQIEKYNALRGYSDNPCDNIPAGHDKNMWLKHNGCLK